MIGNFNQRFSYDVAPKLRDSGAVRLPASQICREIGMPYGNQSYQTQYELPDAT
jgi:hypothetical protein